MRDFFLRVLVDVSLIVSFAFARLHKIDLSIKSNVKTFKSLTYPILTLTNYFYHTSHQYMLKDLLKILGRFLRYLKTFKVDENGNQLFPVLYENSKLRKIIHFFSKLTAATTASSDSFTTMASGFLSITAFYIFIVSTSWKIGILKSLKTFLIHNGKSFFASCQQ